MELPEHISKHHRHDEARENQCSSTLTKHIKAPVDIVWSLVRRFDEPQKYKPFVRECSMKQPQHEVRIGSLREVNVKSGLPATRSTERLEHLDDVEHIFGIRIIGGDHRLRNYSSIITLHPDGQAGTLVVESFVVDVPEENTKEETICFVESLITFNLKSLADVSERMAARSLNDDDATT